MRSVFLTSLFALAAAAPLAAQEATRIPVVVELYTSQGCSSCPPADKMLKEISGRDDVLALALHVDYWDYIGWTDIFGNPRYTQRQKQYARRAGDRTIYTPQFVVGGQDRIVGAQAVPLMDAMRRIAADTSGVALGARRDGDTLRIAAQASSPLSGPVAVQVVRFTPIEHIKITRGENAGLSAEYSNVVKDWQLVGEWAGVAPLSLSVPVEGADPIAVILQVSGQGKILAAGRID